MTWQTLAPMTVQIASDGGPYTVLPTWQTVSSDIVGVTCTRGRSERLSTFSSGTAHLRAKSLTRKYDPDYAGRLAGLQLGRQVRVRATRSAVTYDVFRGHIDSITNPYTHRGDIAEIDCVDLLAELAQTPLLDSAHAVMMKSFTPAVWWRFDETGMDASGNGNDAAIGIAGPGANYVDPLEVGGTGRALTAPFFARVSRPMTGAASDQRSVSFLVQATGNANASFANMINIAASGYPGSPVSVLVDSFGNVSAVIGAASLIADRQVFDGKPHHVLAVRNAGNAYLYIDGTLSATSAAAGAVTSTLTTFACESLYDLPDMIVAVDELAVLEWAVDATSALALALAALTGWAGDSADARIARIATLLFIPSGRLDLEAASTACGIFRGGTDVASYIQQIAAGENGRVFVPGNGKLTFQARTHDLTTATAATFLDSTTGVRYLALSNRQSRQKVITRASVSGVDVSGEYVDAAAEGIYGTRGASASTVLSTGAACRGLAQHIVAQSNAPVTRPGQWRASVSRTAADIAALLGIDIGSKCTISRTPMGIGPAVASAVAVEQVTHEIDAKADWQITYSGAPLDTTPLFRWNTSTWNGSDGWSY